MELNEKDILLIRERLCAHFSQEELMEIGARPFDRSMRVWLASFDFEFFCRFYLAHHFTDALAPLHHDLMNDIQETVDSPDEAKLLEIIFRGAGKTTITLTGLPLWAICFLKRHFIVVISDSESMAVEKAVTIKHELETNERIKEDFGDLVGKKNWADGEFVTANLVKVLALGSSMNIRGRKYIQWRPDLIILDDIENKKEVRSPTQRRQLLEWWRDDVLKAGSSDAKYIIIGTYLSYDCALLEMAKSPVFWRRRNVPAINRREDGSFSYATNRALWDEWEDRINNLSDPEREAHALAFYKEHEAEMLEGVSVAWPARHSYYDLMLKRLEGAASFNTEYLNEPNDPDSRFFNWKTYRKMWNYEGRGEELWLVPWDEQKRCPSGWEAVPLSACALFAATDPSMGHTTKSDFSAILIVAKSPLGQKFVLEADIKRRTPDQIIQDQIRWYQRYPQIIRWAIESNQFQAFFRTVAGQESLKHTSGLPIVQTPQNNTSKDLRIQSLQPDLQNGYLLLDVDGQELLKQQLERYPHTTYDDGPDALEMARNLANDWRAEPSPSITIATAYQFGQKERRKPEYEEEEEPSMPFPILL